MSRSKKVQLVLGGGGARGIAHIKVIELLKRDDYEIESVIGCSMGAVVGGMHCTGHLDIYRDWLLSLNRSQLFKLLDFTLTNIGFLKGERVLGKMQDITGDQLIEDLPIPFVAVATDMIHRKEVAYREGDLYAAMRASMSIPGIFTPVMHEDSILVDGGVLNPLPLNLADRSSRSLIVGVSLYGNDGMRREEQVAKKNWLQKKLFPTKSKSEPVQPRLSLVDLMTKSYELTQNRLVELTVGAYQPDILIEIPRSACGLFDFHKAAHMLEIGEEYYEKAMSGYRLQGSARRQARRGTLRWLFGK